MIYLPKTWVPKHCKQWIKSNKGPFKTSSEYIFPVKKTRLQISNSTLGFLGIGVDVFPQMWRLIVRRSSQCCSWRWGCVNSGVLWALHSLLFQIELVVPLAAPFSGTGNSTPPSSFLLSTSALQVSFSKDIVGVLHLCGLAVDEDGHFQVPSAVGASLSHMAWSGR